MNCNIKLNKMGSARASSIPEEIVIANHFFHFSDFNLSFINLKNKFVNII